LFVFIFPQFKIKETKFPLTLMGSLLMVQSLNLQRLRHLHVASTSQIQALRLRESSVKFLGAKPNKNLSMASQVARVGGLQLFWVWNPIFVS
jgi:hypothetical protein